METEKIIKFIILGLLVLGLLLVFLVPRMKIAKKLTVYDTLYTATQILGIISGIFGLIFTLNYPEKTIRLHLWELIVLPYVIIQFFWIALMRIKKTTNLLDEKQNFDMSKAGGITMAVSILAMSIVFQFYYNKILSGPIWYPVFLFIVIGSFSATTLILFKKN